MSAVAARRPLPTLSDEEDCPTAVKTLRQIIRDSRRSITPTQMAKLSQEVIEAACESVREDNTKEDDK
jgi:hypothetical protein